MLNLVQGQHPSLMHSITSRGEAPWQLTLLISSLSSRLFLWFLHSSRPIASTQSVTNGLHHLCRGPWSAPQLLPDWSTTHSPTRCALTLWELNSNQLRIQALCRHERNAQTVGSFEKLQKVPAELLKPVYKPSSCQRFRTCKVTHSHCNGVTRQSNDQMLANLRKLQPVKHSKFIKGKDVTG